MFVSSILELKMYGRICDNSVPAVGVFHTVRGGIVRRGNRFRPRIIGVVDVRKTFCSEDGIEYSPGAGGFTNPSQSAISQWGRRFYTVRGGIDPGDHRSRPRFVGAADLWKDFRSGDGTMSRPGGAGQWLHEPQAGVSTPLGAVLTRGTTMFVSSMLEL